MSRGDRGALVRALRLVGERTSDSWTAPTSDPRRAIGSGAEWVRDRLVALAASNGRSAKVLDRICLDVDGSACSWVSATGTDRRMVRALIEGAAGAMDADEGGPGASSRFPDLPDETDYEPLASSSAMEGGVGASARIGVIATPDVAARLMLDELDSLGVRVGGVMSVWQALASAWDAPDVGAGGVRADRIVADERPMTAVVAVDPEGSRVVWVWSEHGRPLAAGSIRLSKARSSGDESSGRIGEEPASTLGEQDIARLALEWLSWSAQIGRTPARAVCIGPFGRLDESVEDVLDAGGAARALATVWPGASVDVLEESDPIGRTLTMLAERGEARDVGELGELATRPGRAHRSMYIWLSGALALGGIAAGVMAFQLWSSASDLKAQRDQINANRVEILNEVGLDREKWKQALLELQSIHGALYGQQNNVRAEPIMPVMAAFDRLTFVLANPDWDLVTISVGSTAVSVRVTVPDVRTAEQLEQAVLSITAGLLEWTPMDKRERAGAVDCNLTGTWSAAARERATP
ncbi:MAG: hypothetical protein R3B57_13495 [Phycisphaerales bacterium]